MNDGNINRIDVDFEGDYLRTKQRKKSSSILYTRTTRGLQGVNMKGMNLCTMGTHVSFIFSGDFTHSLRD